MSEIKFPMRDCATWDARFTKTGKQINVRAYLDPEPGISQSQLATVAASWQREVSNVWNGPPMTDHDHVYNCSITWVAANADPHYRIYVRNSGSRRPSLTRWHLLQTVGLAAHEFGHMIGNIDEYRHCNRNPVGERSIMETPGGLAHFRHFNSVHEGNFVPPPFLRGRRSAAGLEPMSADFERVARGPDGKLREGALEITVMGGGPESPIDLRIWLDQNEGSPLARFKKDGVEGERILDASVYREIVEAAKAAASEKDGDPTLIEPDSINVMFKIAGADGTEIRRLELRDEDYLRIFEKEFNSDAKGRVPGKLNAVPDLLRKAGR